MTYRRRVLGPTQAKVLRALVRYKVWAAQECGWMWATPYDTRLVLDALVRRELVAVTRERLYADGSGPWVLKYRPTEAGVAAAAAS
jgi:hypothetical protein